MKKSNLKEITETKKTEHNLIPTDFALLYVTNWTDDVDKYGYIKASILGRMRTWEYTNKLKDENEWNGYYWCINLTPAQLRKQTGLELIPLETALDELIEQGLILSVELQNEAGKKLKCYRLCDELNYTSKFIKGTGCVRVDLRKETSDEN